jgi:hypothetical protein
MRSTGSTPGCAPSCHSAGQQGHRRVELPQPVCVRPGEEAQDLQQLRAPGGHTLPPPGARKRQEGAHLPVTGKLRDPGPPAPGDLRRAPRRTGSRSTGAEARSPGARKIDIPPLVVRKIVHGGATGAPYRWQPCAHAPESDAKPRSAHPHLGEEHQAVACFNSAMLSRLMPCR